jgi:hypothetical protein
LPAAADVVAAVLIKTKLQRTVMPPSTAKAWPVMKLAKPRKALHAVCHLLHAAYVAHRCDAANWALVVAL